MTLDKYTGTDIQTRVSICAGKSWDSQLMEHIIVGSSANAAIDPDRIIIQHFEQAANHSTPISIISTCPSGHSVTFALPNQDHTLGNALRWILSRYGPEMVEFVGYSMPHPSEAKVHLRIQVGPRAKQEGKGAVAVLREGLRELRQIYVRIRQGFQESVKHE